MQPRSIRWTQEIVIARVPLIKGTKKSMMVVHVLSGKCSTAKQILTDHESSQQMELGSEQKPIYLTLQISQFGQGLWV